MPVFDTPNSTQSYEVPDGVQQLAVDIQGAGGGQGGGTDYASSSEGGRGGRIQGVLSVQPGDTLTVELAAAGSPGDTGTSGAGGTSPYYAGGAGGMGSSTDGRGGGGGGGGATALYHNGTLVAVAGGGGGGGGASTITGNEGGSGGGGARGGSPGSADSEYRGDAGGGSGSDGGAGGDTTTEDSAAGDPGKPGDGVVVDTSLLSDTTTTLGGGNTNGASATLEIPEPAPPQSATQTITGETAITVDATPDTSWGAIEEYRIEASTDNSGWTHAATVTGLPYEYSASASDDEHEFRVRAQNSYGGSAWTSTGVKSTQVASIDVVGVDGSSFDLDWDAADDSTEYDVLVAGASGSSEGDYTVDQTTSGTSATVTGLENGERYYARVVARYPGVDSLSTVEADTTTSLPSPVLDSVSAGKREASVTYSLPDNSSDGDVTIELSLDGGSTWPHEETVSDLAQTEVTFSGLLDGITYTARVTRSTDHADATSGTASAQTILPAPTNHQYSNVTAVGADHSWTSNHNNGTTKLQARHDGSGWQDVVTGLDHTADSYTIASLLHGEQYDVRVVAETEDTAAADYDPDVRSGETYPFEKPLVVADSEFQKPLENSGTVQPNDT